MGKLGEGRKLSNEERAALVKKRLSNATSLETPKDQDIAEIGAEIGAGFTPLGFAQSGRDLVRAVKEGDVVDGGLALAGMIPGFGGVTKVVKNAGKVRKALDAASDAKKMIPKTTREAVEKAIKETGDPSLQAAREQAYRGFGSKEEQEAKRFKQIQKELKNQPDDAGRVGGQREGGDVPADYYRKMYEEKGKDAVIKSAEKGEHLHKRADGSYIGAPRHIKSPQALASTRRSLDNQFDESLDAVRQAETEAGTPERVGTWYDRAKAGGASVNEPHQYDRYLEGTAAYSAGVAPETELAFNLKHQNSRALGDPQMAYRNQVMNTLDDAVAENRPAKLAAKVGEYRSKNDARVPEVSPFGVNDFRYAQTQGYTDAQGMPWKAGVQKTMHPFMDAETALATERANMRNPSETGREWSGAQFQELPWVYGKGQDIYGRGFKGRFKGEGGVGAALREANKTTADFFPKHTIGGTYEYVPGANTGHVPEVANMTDEGKRAYGQQGRWDVETPMASLGKLEAGIGEGRRDAIYSAMGMRQLPTVEGVGHYTNTAGQVENNPVNVARVLGDFPTGDSGTLNPNTREAVAAAEKFRSAMDAQEAGAAHIAFTGQSRHGNTGLLVDTDAAEAGMPRQVNPEEMARIAKALEGTGFSPSASPRGVAVNNYNDYWFNMPQSKVQVPWATTKNEVINKLSAKLRGHAPEGSAVHKADFDSVYEPNDFSQPFSGNVTSSVLQKFADLPENVSHTVSNNIGESEAVRGALRGKIDRDSAFASARPDVQNMRQFFAEANWPKAVEMIRKGVAPAAAVGALGYSLNSMADEN